MVEGYNRCDCLDLVDEDENIIGGLLYEGIWPEIGPKSWINGRNI